MKVIWHFYANQVNMGDWASALGIRQFLSASIHDNVGFVDRFLLQEVTDSEVDEINRRADLVVVGGGGLWFRKDLPLGWYWNIKPEQLHALRCPIVLYSIGLNDIEYFRPARWALDQHAIDGILQVVNRAALVGVRDYWTLNWLKKRNISDAYLVPCPSMFLEGDTGKEQFGQGDVIGINIASVVRLADKRSFFAMIENLIGWIMTNGFRVRYLCHDSQPHNEILQLAERFPGDLIIPQSPFELLRGYASVKIVIGMRAHSILFAFNQNRPIFAITYSRKCEAFLKLLDVENYSIKWSPSLLWAVFPFIWKWAAGPLAHRKAKSKICRLVENASKVQSSWQYYRNLYRRYNEEFAARVATLL